VTRRNRRRLQTTPIAEVAQDIVASRLRLLGVAVLCAKVSLVPVVFDYSADFPFPIAKALVSHGLSYLLAGILVGLFILFGRAFLRWSVSALPVLAFLAVSAAATVFAADVTLALFGTHGRMLGLGTIVDGVVLYFGVVLLVRTRADWVALAASLLAASLVVLAYELMQLAGRDPYHWSNINGALTPFSTIGQPTTLAHYLTVLAVGAFAAGLLFQGWRRALRVLLLLFSGLFLAGAVATGTRSAVIGIAAGALVLIASSWLRHPALRARTLIILTGACAAVALTVFVALTPIGPRLLVTVRAMIGRDVDQADPSAASRTALYGIALDMFKDRPILGYGPDNFTVGVPRYRPEFAPADIRQSLATSAHSWVADVATSSGLLGLLSYVAIAVVALALAVRGGGDRPVATVAAAMLSAYLGAGLTTVSDIATEPLFWLSVGAIAAVTAPDRVSRNASPVSRSSRAPTKTPSASGLARTASALCAVVGAALLISITSAWSGSRTANQADDARLIGQVPQAIDLATSATQSDPRRAEYWHGLGLAYVAGARWPEAVAALDRASTMAPYDVRYINDLIAAVVSSGAPDIHSRAVQLAERGVRVDPNNPQAQLTRAQVMQLSGNLPEALRSVERALALDPQSTNLQLWVTATQVYLDSGRPADAVKIARQGLAIIDALEISVRSVPLRYELARALATAGQRQDALAEIDLILRIRPGYTPAQQLRSQLGG